MMVVSSVLCMPTLASAQTTSSLLLPHHSHSTRSATSKQKRKTTPTLSDTHHAAAAIKRPRLSQSPSSSRASSRSSSPSPASSPANTPPPTPVLAHKTLPKRNLSPSPSPPPSSPSPSPTPSRTIRPSRYQHFTSPLSPQPLHPHPMSVMARRQHMAPARAISPPGHRYNSSLLHWTLNKNHHIAVRQRQYLASLSCPNSSTSSKTSYHPLQIHPYHPRPQGSEELEEDDDDDDSEDDDAEWGEGWDEGEFGSEQEPEPGWSVVPSQPYDSATRSKEDRTPRSCTPPSSSSKEKEEREKKEEEKEEGEPIVIREGVTTIVLS